MIREIMEKIQHAKSLPIPHDYEVRWSIHTSQGFSNIGAPKVQNFTTEREAKEYAKALSEAMDFCQGSFWESPFVRRAR